MRSQEHLGRLLGLVPYLLARPGVSVKEAAGAFGITPAELVKDLWTLFVCGLPGGLPGDLIEVDMDAVEGEGVIHLTNADYLSRPMQLLPDEVLGLLVALQSLGHLVRPDAVEAVASATHKLRGLLGSAEVPVEVSIEAGEAPAREALVSAIEGGRRVQLRYHSARRTSSPLIDPRRLDVVGGYAYVAAWNVDIGAWRHYRLDRIEEVADAGQSAQDWGEPPAAGSWFKDAATVTLLLRPPAQWVLEYYHPNETRVDGEDVIATLPVLSPDWAVALILRLGANVEVVQPTELNDTLRAQAREALARYRALSD